ncbi:MAG: ATP-dependent DNA helicase [Halobacteria archaeon]|nr:ATP-dependent DNA helicase [Halobacteria archaeon]
MTDYYEPLGEEGPLARTVPGFSPRAPQQEMAAAVAAAIEAQHKLIVEAGTGTGKTFAYLMPALDSGKKIIISTGTRHLQDQLYRHDLPVVRDALQAPVHIALLKGRSNYLCHHRLALAASEGRSLSRQQARDLETIRAWSGRTRSGDISGLTEVSEHSLLWPRVTSTIDNCLGQECEYFQECFVVKARRKALEADVVVINHHLLFADMVLKEEGFGELLPGVDVFIIDEAHQLPEVASLFFGTRIGSHQMLDLVRDIQVEHLREAGDMAELPEAASKLEGVVRRFRLALGSGDRRAAWTDIAGDEQVRELLQELAALLSQLVEWLEQAAGRGKGLESCWQRSRVLSESLDLLVEGSGSEYIHWFETQRQAFRLNLTPLNVAPSFTRALEVLPRTWVFTSATLAVGASFTHYTLRLGLDAADTLLLQSPFDYAHNALLYLPREMPDPNDRGYTHAVVACAREVLVASRGRAFMLFTSHSALQEAASLLEGTIDYPLLVQGTAPRTDLLEQFRRLGNAVLLGTSSFWEGVDVRGDALSCVIIDRLPFASPGDPVLQARIESLRQQGRNPFIDYQLPNAVIALKQGIGRLIRDTDDRGVLVLCDPRLSRRSYGRVFLNSLPDMPRTQDPEAIAAFFSGVDSGVVETSVMEQTL